MSKTIKLFVAPVLMCLLFAGVGCESQPDRLSDRYITAEDVREDWSPELFSTTRSFGQYQNMAARSVDETGRQAWDDLATIFLYDEPLRLNDNPIP